MDGPPGVACMDTRHPRRLLAPEQVLMRFSIIYDRPSTNRSAFPELLSPSKIAYQRTRRVRCSYGTFLEHPISARIEKGLPPTGALPPRFRRSAPAAMVISYIDAPMQD